MIEKYTVDVVFHNIHCYNRFQLQFTSPLSFSNIYWVSDMCHAFHCIYRNKNERWYSCSCSSLLSSRALFSFVPSPPIPSLPSMCSWPPFVPPLSYPSFLIKPSLWKQKSIKMVKIVIVNIVVMITMMLNMRHQ